MKKKKKNGIGAMVKWPEHSWSFEATLNGGQDKCAASCGASIAPTVGSIRLTESPGPIR